MNSLIQINEKISKSYLVIFVGQIDSYQASHFFHKKDRRSNILHHLVYQGPEKH